MPYSLLSAVEATPWAILPEKMAEIMAFLDTWKAGNSIPTPEMRAEKLPAIAAKVQSVGVLALHGTITQRANMMQFYSGGTSTERFGAEFNALMADSDVSSIVIDVDSPGGAVAGVHELSEMIFNARGKKKITAVVDAMCASAAYYIASAAHEVVAMPSALQGSIGVVFVHREQSKLDEKVGITTTIIKAGDNKAEGNPFEPLKDDAKGHLQSLADDFYQMFVSSVARNRNITSTQVESSFGQGRVFTAKKALAVGMIDGIETLTDVLARHVQTAGKVSKGRAAFRQATNELDLMEMLLPKGE